MPVFHKGDPLSASQLNAVAEAVRRILGGVQPPRQVAGRGRNLVALRQFKVQSLQTDYLICREWDGYTEGDADVRVALPWLLRRTPHDGAAARASITYTYTDNETRTADNGASTETQVIIPSYVASDIIYAERGIFGGTSLNFTDSNGNDIPVEWLDTNVDGRAWAKQAGS